MDAFDLNRTIIAEYEDFSRSFANILSPDLRNAVDRAYGDRRYVREPLVSLNPRYRLGASVNDRAMDGTILGDTAQFRRDDRHRIGKVAVLFHPDHRCRPACPCCGRAAAHAGRGHLSDECAGEFAT